MCRHGDLAIEHDLHGNVVDRCRFCGDDKETVIAELRVVYVHECGHERRLPIQHAPKDWVVGSEGYCRVCHAPSTILGRHTTTELVVPVNAVVVSIGDFAFDKAPA